MVQVIIDGYGSVARLMFITDGLLIDDVLIMQKPDDVILLTY